MATQITSWKHSEVFPLIAHVITAEFQQHQRFITSREIADALLRDPEARRIIDAAVQQRRKAQNAPRSTWLHGLASALRLSSRSGAACSIAHASITSMHTSLQPRQPHNQFDGADRE